MAGTLTTSAGATSFRFLTGDCFSPGSSSTGSAPKACVGVRNVRRPSLLHAVVEEQAAAAVEVEKMKPRRSLYDVLRVDRNASPSEIKSAYRSLAKRYHPDAAASGSKRNGDGDGDRDFIDIHNAYATLSDPTARALYDLKLSTGLERRSRGVGVGVGRRSSEFYSCRRWETDQCW